MISLPASVRVYLSDAQRLLLRCSNWEVSNWTRH